MLRDRFSGPLDPAAVAYSSSTREDAALLPYDLWGSLAHASMLGSTGIIPRRSAARLARGLKALAREVERGRFLLDPALEDVHLNVETALRRRIGIDAERLHTGRSRNDQVAVDLLLYLRDALLDLERAGAELVGALLVKARSTEGRRVVAGWTHFQPAQRIYWGQLLGTHALRFLRDVERLRSIRDRMETSPLGSGAIAGSSLPLDRNSTARQLGFARPGLTSLDGVTDRDAAVDTLGALALLHTHASALAEELVVGSMPEVARVRLADPFVTTSSLMPHKRNPDMAELVRASTGPAVGRLVAHLTVLKSVPTGYQRDLQTGKPLLIEGVDNASKLLAVLSPMVSSAEFLEPEDRHGSATASVELADELVRRGVPFRSAHRRLAQYLRMLEQAHHSLATVNPSALRRAFPELPRGFRLPSPREEPEWRRTRGGSSWREVERLLAHLSVRRRIALSATDRETQRLRKLKRALGAPMRGG